MKPTTKANTFILVGAACILANVAETPLGLPDGIGVVLAVLGTLFIWGGVWVLRRAKERGDIAPVMPTRRQYNRRVALMVSLVVLASLTSPFYLPYTGVTLLFSQLVVCALISCAISVTAVLVAMRSQRPKA